MKSRNLNEMRQAMSEQVSPIYMNSKVGSILNGSKDLDGPFSGKYKGRY